MVLEWGFQAGAHDFGVQASVGRARATGPAQTIARTPANLFFFGSAPFGRATLGADGSATVLYSELAQMPTGPVYRLLAADGR